MSKKSQFKIQTETKKHYTENPQCQSCDEIFHFIPIFVILPFPRCIFWWCVYWNGWSCFSDGKRSAGKPLQHHALSLLQPFFVLQHHHELSEKNCKTPNKFQFSGSSVYIWHDQRASSWSLPIRHAFPHSKFSSEYYQFLEQ